MGNKKYITYLAIFIFIIGGCTLNEVGNSTSETVTKEDLQAASQILGESLSNDNSGIVLSIDDALSIISQSGFSPKRKYHRKGNGGIAATAPAERKYQYSYNADTGIHTASFIRRFRNALFSKLVTDTLQYIYRNRGGIAIEFPAKKEQKITSISYFGYRQGETSTLDQETIFIRKDSLLFTGINGDGSIRVEGSSNDNGSTQIYRYQQEALELTYKLHINFLNIQISQDVFNTKLPVGKAISGTMRWNLVLSDKGSNNSSKLSGSIIFNADGFALLRFDQSSQRYLINLENGDAKNLNSAFAGKVVSVNPVQKKVSLSTGYAVYLQGNTVFENEAFPGLEVIEDSLNAQRYIEAEGSGSVTGNRFLASDINFRVINTKPSAQKEEPLTFDAIVTDANDSLGTVTLQEKAVIRLSQQQTTINKNSDYTTLKEVAEGLQQNKKIRAKGESTLQSAFGDRITARIITFENE